MTATNIVLTEEQMKLAASRMNNDIQERLNAGKSVSHAWLLESMSKGLSASPMVRLAQPCWLRLLSKAAARQRATTSPLACC